MALRVIAGTAGGRRLVAPKGDARPTTDRLKEALFSSLGERVRDASVLDLYAGSGALAIEVLSRGASRAVLVDSDRAAEQAIRANLESTGFVWDARTLTDTTLADRVRGVAEAAGVPVVDLLPLLRQTHDRALYFPRDGHWTPAGHMVAAASLVDVVIGAASRDPRAATGAAAGGS